MQGYVATHGTTPATRQRAVRRDQGLHADRHDRRRRRTCSWSTTRCRRRRSPSSSTTCSKNPGKVSYGSSGPGSLTHLTMELFKQQSGTFMLHVPYRGIAPAFTDLLGGQTQAMFPGLAAALPHLRPDGVARARRHRARRATRACPTCRRSRSSASRASTRCSGTAPSARPASRPTSCKRLNDTQVAVLKDPELREQARQRSGRADADDARAVRRSTSAPTSQRWTRARQGTQHPARRMTAARTRPPLRPHEEPTVARNTQVAADDERAADHRACSPRFVAGHAEPRLERRGRARSASHVLQLARLRDRRVAPRGGRSGARRGAHARAGAAGERARPRRPGRHGERRACQRHQLAHLRFRRHAPEDDHPSGRAGGLGGARARRAARRVRAAT